MSKKLDLKSVLYSLDSRNKSYYSKLPDELKKEYAPYVLMRFMSSAPDQNGLHAYHVLAANDLVNQDFWTLSKYPELQHMLLSMVGVGRKQYHPWIPPLKRPAKDKVADIFKNIYPDINDMELKILYNLYTVKDIEDLCKSYGMTNDETKEITESFKKITK